MNRRFYTLTFLQIVAAAALLYFVFSLHAPWDWQRLVGTILVVISIGGIATARVQLGASFAIKPEARELITHGIYSKIRNPIYVFGAILIAGFALCVQRTSVWIFLAVVIILQIVRAHREAQVLEAAFGEDYRNYRRKTWF
jgi:protein-S-isoprenylcysteine O-methyltransferase Ste14